MKKKKPDNHGFTLIEIIVSMVVLAILGVIAGRGMVEMASGYVLSKKNATVAQLGQITVDRLKEEFSSIQSITCGGPSIITYSIQRSAAEGYVQSSVYLVGGNNPTLYLLTPGCTDCTSCIGGDKLADSISNFTLSYCNTPSITTTANCSATFPNSPNFSQGTLSFVKFTLKLTGYGPTPTSMATISVANPDIVFLNLESGS